MANVDLNRTQTASEGNFQSDPTRRAQQYVLSHQRLHKGGTSNTSNRICHVPHGTQYNITVTAATEEEAKAPADSLYPWITAKCIVGVWGISVYAPCSKQGGPQCRCSIINQHLPLNRQPMNLPLPLHKYTASLCIRQGAL